MKTDGRDFFIIDSVASLVLWFIFFRTLKYREEIKFGPYSMVRDSATSLATFALFETLFANAYLLKTIIFLKQDCTNHATRCEIFSMIDTIIYQCWLIYPILFNWQMASMNKLSRSDSENPGRSTSFLSAMTGRDSLQISLPNIHG